MMQSETGRVRALKALVFDSGLGGLTVLRELAGARPDLVLVYAADDAAFLVGWRQRVGRARVQGDGAADRGG
jgi:hypothetical protein